MYRIRYYLFAVLAITLALLACAAPAGLLGKTVTVTILYGSEKQEWLEPMITQYNAAQHKLEDGTVIVVEATPMGSIESMDAILSGESQPVVWSPASDIYVPLANAEWRKDHAEDLVTGDPEKLVLSPVVIAMWQPMAEALGWPDKQLGWADIAALATSKEGWTAYGYPMWGTFKLGHTHPDYSNSGFVSILAEAYAGAGKQRDLTVADLHDEHVKAFMADVESSIIHYGSSTGFFADQMFTRGPSYLSAAVLYENLVVEQESKRLAGENNQLPVVAIYPKEGTFWSNHPYIILNAPWVTDEQKTAAADFQSFLLDKPQQAQALAYGFRPASSLPLTSPLDADHGVDPSQPKTILETPSADVLTGVRQVWRETKKLVDLVVVVDISGSMSGDKIAAVRSSLTQFIDLLDDRDNLEVILFDDQLYTMTPLSPLGEKRENVLRQVSGIVEGSSTRLYDAVQLAYTDLQSSGSPDHIQAIVVLSDGADNASQIHLAGLVGQIGATTEGGTTTKVFTIAFGADAEQDILKQIAEATGAKMYVGDPKTIRDVYAEIAKFF
jgi:Ca-activated chloride channel family protein